MIVLPRNPWQDLPERAPFVLPADRLAVDVFNRRMAADVSRGRVEKTAYAVDLETCPEPFLGSINAPVVVLLLNPGSGEIPAYRQALLRSYATNDGDERHPYLVAAAGIRWWKTLVAPLLRDGIEQDLIACSVLSIEYFPYRSTSFGCGHIRVASQEYAFALVRRSLSRNTVIVVARGGAYWLGAVPELHAYPRTLFLSNPRMASLSARNLGPSGYSMVRSAVSGRDVGG